MDHYYKIFVCPICNVPFKGVDFVCEQGHKFEKEQEVINLLVNPSLEIQKEIRASQHSAIKQQSIIIDTPMTSKEILQDNLVIQDIKNYIKNNSQLFILELGSGFCYLAYNLAKTFSNATMIASDIIFPKTKEWGEHLPNLLKVNFSMDKIPIKNNSIDFVIVKSSLHHVSNLDAAFSEVCRILKNQGSFLIFNEPTCAHLEKSNHFKPNQLGYNDQYYYLKDYKRAAQKVGFRFQIQIPSTFDYFLQKLPPDSKKIKKFKILIAQVVHRFPFLQFLIKKMYPILIYLFLLPSFFICKK